MEFLKDSIINLGTSIVNGLQSILEFLFVPGDFNYVIDELYNLFLEKFAFVYQVLDIIDEIKSVSFSDSLPDFTITLYGKKLNFVDFSMFDQYRVFIHDLTVAISYFFYFIWLLSEIPSVIGGITSGQYTVFRTNQYQDYLDRHNIDY